MKDTLVKCFILESEIRLEQRQQVGHSKPLYKIRKNTELHVYNENNEPPHFHLVFNKNYDNDNCCFRIDKNTLYQHGKHDGYLDNYELKQLNKIIKENNFEVWKKI